MKEEISHNVCDYCGGELSLINTKDNSGNPTKWMGCTNCNHFTHGVPLRIFKIAHKFVAEDKFVYYHHLTHPNLISNNPQKEEIDQYIQSQTSGTCGLVKMILEMASSE